MSFMETGDPSERIKKAFLAALMGGGAGTGTQFAMPDGGNGDVGFTPRPSSAVPLGGPLTAQRDPDPGMTPSFPAPANNFTLPPNTVSDLGGFAGPHSAPPVDTSRLDDLRAKSAAIPDNGVAPVHGLKDHLLNILKTLAPVAAGGMMFGLPGAAGAARGVEGAYQRKADLNIARKHSLEGEAEQESQSVDKQKQFNLGMDERQREFGLKQQEVNDQRDFQREQLANSKKGAPTLQQFGDEMKQWNPETKQWDDAGPAKSNALTPKDQEQFKLEEERNQTARRGQDMTDSRMREQNSIARESKVTQQRGAEENKLTSFEANLDRLATAANEVKNHPGLAHITGKWGVLPNVPGGEAANAQAKLDALKSQVGFSVLQDMRSQSKTGGALGQISDKEEKLLQDNLAALDKAQSTEEFKKSLQQIIDYTGGAKQRARTALNNSFSGGKDFSQELPTQGGVKVGDKIKLKNGTTVTVKVVHPDGSFD